MLIDKLKEKYPNNNLIKLLANKKVRSLIYLLFWCVFIFIIYLVYLKPIEEYNKNNLNQSVTNNKEIIEDNKKEKTFADMQNDLLTENFAFTFTKNTPEGKAIYKGESLYDEKVGYKESQEGIIKYYIKGDKYYIINFDELNEASKEKLYEKHFDISYIFSLINGINPIIDDNIYFFQNENIYVKITLGVDSISQIEITNNDENYLLEFTNVNLITEIKY